MVNDASARYYKNTKATKKRLAKGIKTFLPKSINGGNIIANDLKIFLSMKKKFC